jgi:hypothetical protein
MDGFSAHPQRIARRTIINTLNTYTQRRVLFAIKPPVPFDIFHAYRSSERNTPNPLLLKRVKKKE